MTFSKLFSFILIIGITASCSNANKARNELEQLLVEWTGKEIALPAQLNPSIYGVDTVLITSPSTPHTVMLYVDSIGCVSCKLRLAAWRQLIHEARDSLDGKLSFIFVFQPKNVRDLVLNLRRESFDYPVYIDQQNLLHKTYNFPANDNFHCFLLDNNKRVVAIGNPTINPKIWTLYKQIVRGQMPVENATADADAEVDLLNNKIDIGKIACKATHNVQFSIRNSGKNALVLSHTTASCGCTNVAHTKHPIAAGDTAYVDVKLTMDKPGVFTKSVQVYGNFKQQMLTLHIVGEAF